MTRPTLVLLATALSAIPASAQWTPTVPAARDTVVAFAVADGTWRWPYVAAHVGLSCRANQVLIGTTTAPGSAAGRESYCAGALVEMRNSTLTLRGARGMVRVRVERTPRGTGRPAANPDSTAHHGR